MCLAHNKKGSNGKRSDLDRIGLQRKVFLKINAMFELIWFLSLYVYSRWKKSLETWQGWCLINSSEYIFSIECDPKSGRRKGEGEKVHSVPMICFCLRSVTFSHLNRNHMYVINLVLPQRFVFCLCVWGTLSGQLAKTFLIFFFPHCRNILLNYWFWNHYSFPVILVLPFYVVVQGHRIRWKTFY